MFHTNTAFISKIKCNKLNKIKFINALFQVVVLLSAGSIHRFRIREFVKQTLVTKCQHRSIYLCLSTTGSRETQIAYCLLIHQYMRVLYIYLCYYSLTYVCHMQFARPARNVDNSQHHIRYYPLLLLKLWMVSKPATLCIISNNSAYSFKPYACLFSIV